MQRDYPNELIVTCPDGEIDMRQHAGGTIGGLTASGTAAVEQKKNGIWEPLLAGGVQVTIAVPATGSEIMPDPLYHAGIIRLTGINGTVVVGRKS